MKFVAINITVFGSPILKRIQIIDYVLAYITMDIDGSASAKEFSWDIFYDHGSNGYFTF